MSALSARVLISCTTHVVAVGVTEPEERAAIALVEDSDLAHLAPRASNSSRAATTSATTS